MKELLQLQQMKQCLEKQTRKLQEQRELVKLAKDMHVQSVAAVTS